MKTIKVVALFVVLIALSSCASWDEAKQKKAERESYANPFYLKYLDKNDPLDREILARIETLRADRSDPVAHNELGAFLWERRFQKDARYEFEQALEHDKRFYPARYNLALLELAEGNAGRAKRLLKQVVDQKPGNPEAQFALGLVYEKSGRRDAAIEHYTKAFTIEPEMIKAKRNPRVVESSLVTATLLEMYERSSERGQVRFIPAPAGYERPVPKEKEAAEAKSPDAAEPQPATVPPAEPAPAAPPPPAVPPRPASGR